MNGNGLTVIFVPGTPKNSNASSQWAPMAAASNRKKFRKLTAKLAAERLEPYGTYTVFVRITAAQVSPIKRRRDPGGLAERLKPLLDGLVDGGLLIDDDEDHIELVLKHSALMKDHIPGILLTLEPMHDLNEDQTPDRITEPRKGQVRKGT